MELSGRNQLAIHKREQCQLATSLIGKPLVGCGGFKCISATVEIFSAHMERLVNVPDIVRQEDDGYGFSYLTVVGLRFFTLQNLNAERNHVNNIKLRPSYFSGSVLFIAEDGHVRIMKEMMRGVATAWISLHERTKLGIDPGLTSYRLAARASM